MFAGAPQTRMMIDSPPLTKVSIGSVPSSALSPAGPSPAHTPSAHDIWIRRDLTGLPVSDEQLRATFQEYDKDGNGVWCRGAHQRFALCVAYHTAWVGMRVKKGFNA